MDDRWLDFLFWHASSKLNNAQFSEAVTLFELVAERRPGDLSALVGLVYCKLRLGDLAGLDARMPAMAELCRDEYQRAIVNRLKLRMDWLRQSSQ